MTELLRQGARILFQGDSITDCGRSRENDSELGFGYANMIAAWLSAKHPELNLVFLNKGISGNRVYDLETRWDLDCIDLEPDILSILIGINDTWRRYDSNLISKAEDYEACYRRILDRAKAETQAKILILEPFVLPTPPDRKTWREDLDPKIEAVKRIVKDYEAIYLPLDEIFAEAATKRDAAFWAADGVHPTQAGHALIAQEWIKYIRQ